ncbi:MAG: class I SAM-dependent methyltransferase [Myxococcales bacterium]|nr:class I SAM-dependent methyltransferase [Myxococcales bacterium]
MEMGIGMGGECSAEAGPVCWICGAGGATLWRERALDRPLRAEDLRITDAGYGRTLRLWRCGECGFIFADGDDLARLEALYGELDDPEYDAGGEARARQMRWLIDLARRARPQARTLLDVGAASGLLVDAAAAAGLDAEGIEPSRSLAAGAQGRGLRVHHGVLPHPALAGRRFDLVALVDVIEHVADPVGLLREAAAHLAPGGALLVVTPDIGSRAARLMGGRWWHLRLAHVGYFNASTLDAALRAAGLRREAGRRARWFFPVGYLAERLERYLPIAGLNRLARRLPLVAGAYRRVIPLDLGDSFVWIAAPAGEGGDGDG